MPLEGKIGSYKFSHETIVTDDHPAVLRSLMMDETVTASVPAGTILKTVTAEPAKGEDETGGQTEQQASEDKGAAYTACTESDTPAAVLVEDFNPSEKAYATCLVHGTVKADLITVNKQKPTLAMFDKLQAMGIFAV